MLRVGYCTANRWTRLSSDEQLAQFKRSEGARGRQRGLRLAHEVWEGLLDADQWDPAQGYGRHVSRIRTGRSGDNRSACGGQKIPGNGAYCGQKRQNRRTRQESDELRIIDVRHYSDVLRIGRCGAALSGCRRASARRSRVQRTLAIHHKIEGVGVTISLEANRSPLQAAGVPDRRSGESALTPTHDFTKRQSRKSVPPRWGYPAPLYNSSSWACGTQKRIGWRSPLRIGTLISRRRPPRIGASTPSPSSGCLQKPSETTSRRREATIGAYRAVVGAVNGLVHELTVGRNGRRAKCSSRPTDWSASFFIGYDPNFDGHEHPGL